MSRVDEFVCCCRCLCDWAGGGGREFCAANDVPYPCTLRAAVVRGWLPVSVLLAGAVVCVESSSAVENINVHRLGLAGGRSR